jgi:hypothetical protein
MTDQLREALADLTRTMRQIRESDAPTPTRIQDGDFFSFPTPGRPAPAPQNPNGISPDTRKTR